MDYQAVKTMVREALWDYMSDVFDAKDCPMCGKTCTMIRVSVEPIDSPDLVTPVKKYWRCLKCLNLFQEELEKIN